MQILSDKTALVIAIRFNSLFFTLRNGKDPTSGNRKGPGNLE
jgi:hypothetical protein